MEILRTSEADAAEILRGINDYPNGSRFVTVPAGDSDGQDLRVHLVDAGDANAPVVVFLHGNPSWSYIWRHQIAAAVAAGYRVIAPDLVGMGLSDKPTEMTDYTVVRHVEWMRALLVDELGLSGATFVLHDWGGVIGMRMAAEQSRPGRAAGDLEHRVCRGGTRPSRCPRTIEASGPLRRLPGVRTDVARVAAVDAAADGYGDRAEQRVGARLPRAVPGPVAHDREPGFHTAPADPA